MRRRIDIEIDDIGEFCSKAGITRPLEGPQAMRLQLVRPPNALYRAQREAIALLPSRSPATGPPGRRPSAGHRHHPGHLIGCDRRPAGLAGLVAQPTLNPLLRRSAAAIATRSAN